MNIVKNIFRSAITSWVAFSVNIIIGIFTVPLMIKYLDESIYGLWIVANSVLMYFNIMTFGMGGAIIKYVSEFKGKNDIEGQNEVINVIFFSYLIISIIISTIVISLYFLFPNLFTVEQISKTASLYLVLILLLNTIISLSLSVFGGVVLGYQRYDFINILNIANSILRFILIWYFLSIGLGIFAVAFITMVSSLIEGIVSYKIAKKLFKYLKINIKYFSLTNLKKIISFSFFTFLNNIADKFIYDLDYIVISYFSGNNNVVFYSIPNRFIKYFRTITIKFLGVLSPTTSELNAKNQNDLIKKLALKSIEYSYALVFTIGIIFIFYGKDLINLWVGNKYILSYKILFILTVSHVMTIPLNILRMILWGLGEVKIPTFFTLSEGLMNFILSIILIKEIGLIGVALGTAISQVLFKGIVLPIYSFKFLKIKITKNILIINFKFIFISSIIIIFSILVKKYLYFYNLYINTFTGILVILLISILFYLFFLLSKTDRLNLISIFK